MSVSFCISLAKPTPVHFQHRIPDRRTNSDHSPHKTGIASTDSARKPEQLLHPFLPQFADPKIERQYRDARLAYRLTALKVTITAGVFISMVFAALDLLTLHDASPPLFYVHITGTVTLLVFLAAVSLRKPNRWIETALLWRNDHPDFAPHNNASSVVFSIDVVLSAYGALDSAGGSFIRCLRRLIR